MFTSDTASEVTAERVDPVPDTRSDSTAGRVAAVIPTYNAHPFAEALLRSLLHDQSTPPDLVYVVDNASTDNSPDRVESAFPQVIVRRLPRNVGYGAACNVGLRLALAEGARFVFVLNQDTVLDRHACQRALDTLRLHPTFGMVAMFQLQYSTDRIDPIFRRYLPHAWIDDLYRGRSLRTYEVDFVPAVAVLLSRSALEDVGGFDPLFFMYKEDRDLCVRLRQRGWKIGLTMDATVHHHGGQTHVVRSWQWECNWAYSEAVMHLKWSPRPWPLPLLTLARRLVGPSRLRDKVVRSIALARCIGRLGTIAQHRVGNPADLNTLREGRHSSAAM
jgi:GT2 family glycosyltransferase